MTFLTEQSSILVDNKRIDAVDSLRGFALLAIILLHSLEHYNIFYGEPPAYQWLRSLNDTTIQIIYFIFAGKAYATFSLLFGFSFFIQMRNARRRGSDFRLRFAWRMLILVGFSQFHALFYNGDILLLYAFCGLILIPASSWSNRTVVWVASILMLQPYCWGMIIYALAHPDYVNTNSAFLQFAASAEEVGRNGDLWETLRNNIWNGQLYSNFWQVEAGRLFQTPALFLLGMWLGRKKYFIYSAESHKFWVRALVLSAVACLPLHLLHTLVNPHISNVTVSAYYNIAIPMLYNFAFMSLLIAAFMLLWFHSGHGYRCQRFIISFGRMSLTNYIAQSIIGVTLYYHFGFNLWDKVGAFSSTIIALAVFTFLLILSRCWLASHRQGPLEYIWKKLTWIGFK